MRNRAPRHQGKATLCAYERLSERLEDLAEREGWSSRSQTIELLGRSMFGDLWEPRPAPEQTAGPSALPPAATP